MNDLNEIIVAKVLTGCDENKFMYKKNTPCLCPECQTPLKKVINPDFKAYTRKAALPYTYDNYRILNEHFKEFCNINEYPDLSFIPFPKSPGYYYFESRLIIPLDEVRRKINFINPCSICGGYAEVIGATPVYLKSGFKLPSQDFIGQSNWRFGVI